MGIFHPTNGIRNTAMFIGLEPGSRTTTVPGNTSQSEVVLVDA